MKHNWWVWSAHLSDAKVESIIKKCESLDKLSGTVRCTKSLCKLI